MSKLELIEKLKGIPDDAEVYVVSSMKELPEMSMSVYWTNKEMLTEYADDFTWIQEEDKKSSSNAVLIC